MKKIILLALTALIMVGCQYEQNYKDIKAPIEVEMERGFMIVEYDSCEYIRETQIGGYSYFAHKGNCRFCKERRQKELKELVEQLKEK